MIRNLIKKYQKQILYLLFGVLTTLINIVAYFLLYDIIGLSNVLSTSIALVLCISVAFITNKLWVFDSKSFEKKIFIHEVLSFVSCRLFTSVIDILIMYITVDILSFNGLFMKVLSNIIVIILNYVASKLIIFRKK